MTTEPKKCAHQTCRYLVSPEKNFCGRGVKEPRTRTRREVSANAVTPPATKACRSGTKLQAMEVCLSVRFQSAMVSVSMSS